MATTTRAGWGTALLVAFILIMTIWGPQMCRGIAHSTPTPANRLPGDWAGTFTINGTWKPEIYGTSPGPHKAGTLFLHIYRVSPNLDWIEGKGQICIDGEPNSSPIQINITDYNDNGSFPTDFGGTASHLGAFPWQGVITHTSNNPDTLTFSNNIELAIHATLHRSTRAAFLAQTTCAPPPEKD